MMMMNIKLMGCKFVVATAALLLLFSMNAAAVTLARQCGAVGIVTYDPFPDLTAPKAHTYTTIVPVPYAWLKAHDPSVVDGYEAYEASAKALAANGRKVWECYVLELDPQISTNDFKISAFPMKADGTPDLAGIVFDPPQARWNVPGARAVLKGAATLDGDWKAVEDATAAEKASFRFFKVEVVLP